jgi:hypothetical protein
MKHEQLRGIRISSPAGPSRPAHKVPADRASVLHQFPETFSVPTRYRKHMMIVADLANGDPGAIEKALEAAWQLQRSAD